MGRKGVAEKTIVKQKACQYRYHPLQVVGNRKEMPKKGEVQTVDRQRLAKNYIEDRHENEAHP